MVPHEDKSRDDALHIQPSTANSKTMKTTSSRKYFWWIPALLWAGGIFYLSSLTFNTTTPPPFEISDKAIHVGLFSVLALFIYLGLLQTTSLNGWRCAGWAFALAVIYGGLDELHQYYVPGRIMDAKDWMADGVGALLPLCVQTISQLKR